MPSNLDRATVDGFGDEWTAFDQRELGDDTLRALFDQYFSVFPRSALTPHAVGVDIGCGSGRWARFVAPDVKSLVCLDPSPAALRVARDNLADLTNCLHVVGAAGELPFRPGSLDFAYSLGVLHHTPSPVDALRDCAQALKSGAPLLVYLYYSFDNRPTWFRALWKVTDGMRRVLSRTPFRVKMLATTGIAVLIYWPLARVSRWLAARGHDVDVVPLSTYRDAPLYVMRNDALDRFATRVEWRFSAGEIRSMMSAARLDHISFRPAAPYWCAVGLRRPDPA